MRVSLWFSCVHHMMFPPQLFLLELSRTVGQFVTDWLHAPLFSHQEVDAKLCPR